MGLCRCCVLEAQGNINGTGTMTTPRARLMLTLFFVNQWTRRSEERRVGKECLL